MEEHECNTKESLVDGVNDVAMFGKYNLSHLHCDLTGWVIDLYVNHVKYVCTINA